jgi:monofunctional chorismate mutase
VTVEEDAEVRILEATAGLLRELLARNGLDAEDVVSIVCTATGDLRSAFPAAAARRVGLERVPVLSARELDVEGAMPRVVRVLLHAHTDRSQDEIAHVYLGEARRLREDLA